VMRRSLSMKMKHIRSSKDYLSFDLRPQGASTSPHSERGYLISVTGHVLARCRVVFSLAFEHDMSLHQTSSCHYRATIRRLRSGFSASQLFMTLHDSERKGAQCEYESSRGGCQCGMKLQEEIHIPQQK
jgi:hypothetical protein